MFRSAIPTAGVFFVAFCLMATGCSSALVGTWESSEPVAEAGDFSINNATFRDDGTYVASAYKGGETVRLAGSYDFDGISLKLKTPGKPERKYSATIWFGQTLELSDGEVKQSLKKK